MDDAFKTGTKKRIKRVNKWEDETDKKQDSTARIKFLELKSISI